MNKVLEKSAPFMLSDDYKDRFLAEFMQIDNRLRGLEKMLEDWDLGILSFEPSCPRETYKFQWKAMRDYRDILVVRAKIEGIDLDYETLL